MKPNNMLERTAKKALVSGGRLRMVRAASVLTHRQAVAQHAR